MRKNRNSAPVECHSVLLGMRHRGKWRYRKSARARPVEEMLSLGVLSPTAVGLDQEEAEGG